MSWDEALYAAVLLRNKYPYELLSDAVRALQGTLKKYPTSTIESVDLTINLDGVFMVQIRYQHKPEKFSQQFRFGLKNLAIQFAFWLRTYVENHFSLTTELVEAELPRSVGTVYKNENDALNFIKQKKINKNVIAKEDIAKVEVYDWTQIFKIFRVVVYFKDLPRPHAFHFPSADEGEKFMDLLP